MFFSKVKPDDIKNPLTFPDDGPLRIESNVQSPPKTVT